MSGFSKTVVSDRALEVRIRKARKVLGFEITGMLTAEKIVARYRNIVKAQHPDSDGFIQNDPATLHQLRLAKDFLIGLLGLDIGETK